MKDEIISINCNSIAEAESKYFERMEEGCWQMVNPIKIVWSWKEFKYVARFSMKRVEKVYTMQQQMKDIQKIISYGCETALTVLSAMDYKRKAKQRLEQLLAADNNPDNISEK